MKKAVTILFICSYLFSYTELHQIFSLPAFFEHYREHRLINPEIGLIDFVHSHYAKAESNSNHDHHHLPFKEDHCLQVLTLNPIYFTEIQLKDFFQTAEESDHNCMYTPGLFFSQLHFSIWQPPRLA